MGEFKRKYGGKLFAGNQVSTRNETDLKKILKFLHSLKLMRRLKLTFNTFQHFLTSSFCLSKLKAQFLNLQNENYTLE